MRSGSWGSRNLSPLEWLFGLEQFGIKFGLENIEAIVEALGHPERSFTSIHVAGTNGKGSVTAMVDRALTAAGYHSARYTSPHLISLNERFVIDGRPVDDPSLTQAAADVRRTVETLMADGRLDVHPTFFEVTTAMAFELFQRAGVDVATCEVGLGGRLDATNVLKPRVTAITSIAFDHQQFLGGSLAEIAREKAGIIKADVPVVVGQMPKEAYATIVGIARERHAPVVDASGTFGETLRKYGEPTLALQGEHQRANAVVAVRVLETAAARGLNVPSNAIVDGLTRVRWPGRLDWRQLDDGREVLLDAAHNPEGARALAAFLASNFSGKPPLVFAVMRDKDAGEMLRELVPWIGSLVLTKASTPRSADPAALADRVRSEWPDLPLVVEPTISGAMASAWRISQSIVAAGSIFLLGDVLKELGGSWYPQA